MKTYKLFDDGKSDTNSRPIYERELRIPVELDKPIYTFRNMSDAEFTIFAEKLRVHLYNLWLSGHSVFYSNKDADEIAEDCLKLVRESPDSFFETYKGKKIITHKNFNVAYQWFPEMADVKVNSKSMIDQLRDPKIFRQNLYDILIKDRQKNGANSYDMETLSKFLLDSLRIVNRFQPVFNFPSIIAKLIYMKVVSTKPNQNEWYILDPCGGWAGRFAGLLAAMCTPLFNDKRIHFYTTDVNTATAGRFEMFLDFWNIHIKSDLKELCDLYRSFEPAETLLNDPIFSKMENMFDIAFTSPPYYEREKYSMDINQSYIKYKTYAEWRDGFLTGLIRSCYRLLKPGSLFLLNIADSNDNSGKESFYPLQDDSIRIAESIGFTLIDTYYMVQHRFPGYTDEKYVIEIRGKKKKFEPIYVFQKGN